jgi:hypothetical protein
LRAPRVRVDAAEARLSGIVERSKRIPAGAVNGLPDLQAVERLFNSTPEPARRDAKRRDGRSRARIKEAAREAHRGRTGAAGRLEGRTQDPRAELVRETHQMEKQTTGSSRSIATSDTLESWMVYIDLRPKVVAQAAPPPAPPTATGRQPEPPGPEAPPAPPTTPQPRRRRARSRLAR